MRITIDIPDDIFAALQLSPDEARQRLKLELAVSLYSQRLLSQGKAVFEAVREMNGEGRTILLVEQNARAGLRLASHGVVLENGRVRLDGTGHEVLHHPDIGALYLGGAIAG